MIGKSKFYFNKKQIKACRSRQQQNPFMQFVNPSTARLSRKVSAQAKRFKNK